MKSLAIKSLFFVACVFIPNIWGVKAQELDATFSDLINPSTAAISSDNRYAITGHISKTTLILWDLAKVAELRSFEVHDQIRAVRFINDSNLFVTVSAKAIKVWDVKTGDLVKEIQTNIESFSATAISDDGNYVAVGMDDNRLKVWELETKEVVSIYRGHNQLTQFSHAVTQYSPHISTVDFSPDNQFILMGSNDESLLLWEIKSDEMRTFLPSSKLPITYSTFSTKGVRKVAFSADGSKALSADDIGHIGSIRLWDIKSGIEEKKIDIGKNRRITSLEFFAGNNYAVASDRAGRVYILDLITGKQIKSFKHSFRSRPDYNQGPLFTKFVLSPKNDLLLLMPLRGLPSELWDLSSLREWAESRNN
jgi:WD40 repeat protein